MTSVPSPIETLNNTISNHNPFKSGLIVRNQDVWGKGFPDVPSLNAHASSAVFEAIEQIRKGQRQAVGITIKAEKGLGKSHVISRIRNQLKAMGGALFVYMADYSNLNRIKPEFLKMLALSLKQIGSQGVMQWQELATSLINEALQKSYTPQQVILSIPQKLANQPNLIECLTQKVLEAKQDIDNPDLVQAILLTLSPHAPFAINWLAGKSLPQTKADQLNLSNPSDEDRDSESFDTICQILDLISHYNALIVCFDQLEGVETNDGGFTKAQVIANLAMDLYNRLKRGVILTAMYPDIWVHHIRAMPTSEAVIDRIGEQIIELKYLNPDDVVSLVSCRLQEFYEENQLVPTHSLYPFEEVKLKELGKQRATARDVLQWCQKNWSVPDIDILSELSTDPVETAFANEMESLNDEEFMDDKSRVAKALILGFRNLIGNTIHGVKVEQVNNVVTPKSSNKDFIDFKIIAEENGKNIKIGVCVLPYSAGVGIQAGLSRLIDYRKFDLTRGCLVRSKAVPPKAKKAQEYLKELLEGKGGEWAVLKVEEIKPLIALLAVYENSSDYDLTTEQIFDFISQHKLSVDNPLLLEILSDPSGQIPYDIIDEEAEMEIPIEVDEFDSSTEIEVDLGEIAA